MKKLHLIALILLVLTSGMLFAWDGFNYVVANEHNSGIRVDWQAKDEHGVHYYEIYRSRSDSDILDKRASVTALGVGASYTFQDDNIFSKSSETGNYVFDYYIRAVMKDGSFKNSDKVQVSLTSLGVTQQTWGSIKAMFR
ncbi:MAG: hypothetical protein K9N05_03345 [Candidatus Marinimicrobia bacterium]|nr:hypothetical protein [Candidatus Neomarinimicrobiota bacterium]